MQAEGDEGYKKHLSDLIQLPPNKYFQMNFLIYYSFHDKQGKY